MQVDARQAEHGREAKRPRRADPGKATCAPQETSDALITVIPALARTEAEASNAVVVQQALEPDQDSLFRSAAVALFHHASGVNLGSGSNGGAADPAEALHAREALRRFPTPSHFAQRVLAFWLQFYAGAAASAPGNVDPKLGLSDCMAEAVGMRVLRNDQDMLARASEVASGEAVPALMPLVHALARWYAAASPAVYLGSDSTDAYEILDAAALLLPSTGPEPELKTGVVFNLHKAAYTRGRGAQPRHESGSGAAVGKRYQAAIGNLNTVLAPAGLSVVALVPAKGAQVATLTREDSVGEVTSIDMSPDATSEGEVPPPAPVHLASVLRPATAAGVPLHALQSALLVARAADGPDVWVPAFPLYEAPRSEEAAAMHVAVAVSEARAAHRGLASHLPKYAAGPKQYQISVLTRAMQRLRPFAPPDDLRTFAERAVSSRSAPSSQPVWGGTETAGQALGAPAPAPAPEAPPAGAPRPESSLDSQVPGHAPDGVNDAAADDVSGAQSDAAVPARAPQVAAGEDGTAASPEAGTASPRRVGARSPAVATPEEEEERTDVSSAHGEDSRQEPPLAFGERAPPIRVARSVLSTESERDRLEMLSRNIREEVRQIESDNSGSDERAQAELAQLHRGAMMSGAAGVPLPSDDALVHTERVRASSLSAHVHREGAGASGPTSTVAETHPLLRRTLVSWMWDKRLSRAAFPTGRPTAADDSGPIVLRIPADAFDTDKVRAALNQLLTFLARVRIVSFDFKVSPSAPSGVFAALLWTPRDKRTKKTGNFYEPVASYEELSSYGEGNRGARFVRVVPAPSDLLVAQAATRVLSPEPLLGVAVPTLMPLAATVIATQGPDPEDRRAGKRAVEALHTIAACARRWPGKPDKSRALRHAAAQRALCAATSDKSASAMPQLPAAISLQPTLDVFCNVRSWVDDVAAAFAVLVDFASRYGAALASNESRTNRVVAVGRRAASQTAEQGDRSRTLRLTSVTACRISDDGTVHPLSKRVPTAEIPLDETSGTLGAPSALLSLPAMELMKISTVGGPDAISALIVLGTAAGDDADALAAAANAQDPPLYEPF